MFEMAITTLAWQGCGPAGMTPAVGTKRGPPTRDAAERYPTQEGPSPTAGPWEK